MNIQSVSRWNKILLVAWVTTMVGLSSGLSAVSGQDSKHQRLYAGDQAPNFKLKSLDGKTQTELAEFAGQRPVVLFFGSYT